MAGHSVRGVRGFVAKEGVTFNHLVKVRLHSDEVELLDSLLAPGDTRADYTRAALREKVMRRALGPRLLTLSLSPEEARMIEWLCAGEEDAAAWCHEAIRRRLEDETSEYDDEGYIIHPRLGVNAPPPDNDNFSLAGGR